MANVAVIGLGSIGSIFAAHLIAANRQRVVCCVHAPVHCLHIEGAYGVIEAQPLCVTDCASAEPADWIFLATKTQDTPATAPWFHRLCRAGTRVAVLQNGVDQEAHVSALYRGPVLPTVVLANGKKLAPHRIRHLSPGDDLVVPDTELGRDFASLFEGTRIQVKPSADFLLASWQKFLANIVANPLTALTGRGIEVVRQGEMEQLALGMLREAAAVGKACGAPLANDAAEQTLEWMSRFPGETGTSMLQDRLDKHPLEYEALTGTVVRLGEQHNIPTPLNRAIRALLQAIR